MQDNQRQALHIAYIAGLFDGEGSFCFIKAETKKFMEMTKRKNPYYRPLARIGMVHLSVLEFIHKTFPGGYLHCEGVRKDRPNNQVMYRWEMFKGENLKNFLKEIIPFLIAKKEQAVTLLEVLENWKIPRNRTLGLDAYELQRREEAYQKMRKLNAVGAAATTKYQGPREWHAIV